MTVLDKPIENHENDLKNEMTARQKAQQWERTRPRVFGFHLDPIFDWKGETIKISHFGNDSYVYRIFTFGDQVAAENEVKRILLQRAGRKDIPVHAFSYQHGGPVTTADFIGMDVYNYCAKVMNKSQGVETKPIRKEFLK